MDMNLRLLADKAESCAQSFISFKEFLPSSSGPHVTAVVTELFGLSKALQNVWKAFTSRHNAAYTDLIADDLLTVSKSLQHTVAFIERQLAPLEEMHDRRTGKRQFKEDAYKQVWHNLRTHFASEGARVQGCETLTSRLDTYRTFVHDLQAKLEGDGTSGKFKDMQYRLEKLRLLQEKSLEDETLGRFAKLGIAAPPTPSFKKQSSWERRRPSRQRQIEGSKTQSASRLPPRINRPAAAYLDTSDSGADDLFDVHDADYDELGEPVDYVYPDEYDDFLPPSAPIAPSGGRMPGQSPSAAMFQDMRTGDYFVAAADVARGQSSGEVTPSAISTETNSTVGDRHWAPIVFGQNRSSTTFQRAGSKSGCYGQHMPGIATKLRDEYEELLKLPFENGLQVRVLIRDRDFRSRILVRQERRNQKLSTCKAITDLRIRRSDSCLQLCLPDPKGKQLVLWTILNFPTYERLVIFWCTFLALKAQDDGKPISRLDDANLDGEVCLFRAVIIDDEFQHALHVLQDKDSKGVRLQASALTGELKRTPIWTAFITYQLTSNTWARQASRRKVHLQDLTRYIFTDDYEPQVGPRGEHELEFVSSKDAEGFFHALEDIASGLAP